MAINLPAAQDFVYANARLLDRRRYESLSGGPARAVVDALRPYLNDDGGLGSALEPDVRGPNSEPTAALHGLEVLAEAGALDDPMTEQIAAWLDQRALDDGGVPFVTAETANYPRGPWMQPSEGGSHLTFGLAGVLYGHQQHPWVARGVSWCWQRLGATQTLDAFNLKFGLAFLDAVSTHSEEAGRADKAVDGLRPLIRPDGTVPVVGGEADEKLTALDLSPRPDSRSRRLFTDKQIEEGLDALESAQQEDGGWDFDWLAWSPGQSAEWRALVTFRALHTLTLHGRLAFTSPREVAAAKSTE